MLVASMPATKTFLSNLFSAIFAFLIINIEIIATDTSNQSKVPIFAFLLVQITLL